MRPYFNASSTALVVDDHLIAVGEHVDLDDSPRVRDLVEAGHLVDAQPATDEPDPEAAKPRKRGDS